VYKVKYVFGCGQSWASYFLKRSPVPPPLVSLSLKAQEHLESLKKSLKVVIQILMFGVGDIIFLLN
jgi:hypothetical protein